MSKRKTNKTDKDKKIIVSKLSPKINFSKFETLDSENENIKLKKKNKPKQISKKKQSKPQDKTVKAETKNTENIKKEGPPQENKQKNEKQQKVKSQNIKKKDVKAKDKKPKEISTDKNIKFAGGGGEQFKTMRIQNHSNKNTHKTNNVHRVCNHFGSIEL